MWLGLRQTRRAGDHFDRGCECELFTGSPPFIQARSHCLHNSTHASSWWCRSSGWVAVGGSLGGAAGLAVDYWWYQRLVCTPFNWAYKNIVDGVQPHQRVCCFCSVAVCCRWRTCMGSRQVVKFLISLHVAHACYQMDSGTGDTLQNPLLWFCWQSTWSPGGPLPLVFSAYSAS